MRKFMAIVAACLTGCASQREWEQYHRDLASWEKENQTSRGAWLGATNDKNAGGLHRAAPNRLVRSGSSKVRLRSDGTHPRG